MSLLASSLPKGFSIIIIKLQCDNSYICSQNISKYKAVYIRNPLVVCTGYALSDMN